MTEIIFDENEDWEKRVLCSDESCIGTIGPDGKCKECGKSYEGNVPEGKINEIIKNQYRTIGTIILLYYLFTYFMFLSDLLCANDFKKRTNMKV